MADLVVLLHFLFVIFVVCTPLENRLRRAQGETGYQGDFIAHYILPALYPGGLTRTHQLFLGALALSINAAIYALVIARRRRSAAKDI